jgi:hypothetical protein
MQREMGEKAVKGPNKAMANTESIKTQLVQGAELRPVILDPLAYWAEDKDKSWS